MHIGMILIGLLHFYRSESVFRVPPADWKQADIITTSMFGYSQDLIHFGDGTHPPLLTCLDGFLCHVHLMTHFPFLVNLAQKLPAIISKRILPGYVDFRKVCPIEFPATADKA